VPAPARIDATVEELVRRHGHEAFHVTASGVPGIGYERVRAAIAAGRVLRVRRGLLRVAPLAALDPTRLHLLRVRDAAVALPPEAVVSHGSAACVHGLWSPGPDRPEVVEVIVPGEPDRLDRGVRIRGSRLEPADVVVVDGLRVTSLARTAIDLARGRDLPRALVALDSAARRLLGDRFDVGEQDLRRVVSHPASAAYVRREISQALVRVWGWPGTRVVRRAVALVEPASESAFESLSRGHMLDGGVPAPVVGLRVSGATGATYFADFAWPEQGLLGEADGWGKYGPEGPSMREAVARERVRQQDLEEAGWRFVRWSPQEAPGFLAARLLRALASSGRRLHPPVSLAELGR
jgi:hypothetical protein